MANVFITSGDAGQGLGVNSLDFDLFGDTTTLGSITISDGFQATGIDAGTQVDIEGNLGDLTYTLNGTRVEVTDAGGNLVADIAAATDTATTIRGQDGAADITVDNGTVSVGGAEVTPDGTSGDQLSPDTDNPADDFDGQPSQPDQPTFSVSDNGPVDEGDTASFTVSLSEEQESGT